MQFISILLFVTMVAVISIAVARLGLLLTLSVAGQPHLSDDSPRLSAHDDLAA